jgi:orotidine-5'-phosphate decarboxylase
MFDRSRPIGSIIRFNMAIIDATKDIALAFKPQSSFYEAYGSAGAIALEETAAYLKFAAPNAVRILDAKRGDIGSTNEGYVSAIFDHMDFDAVTLHPTLGMEATKPFLDRKDKGCIILCRTSNPGAGEFQDVYVSISDSGREHQGPLYERFAVAVAHDWNYNNNCAIVVGSTYPRETKRIREIAPGLPFLMPGFGAQGGEVAIAVQNGCNAKGGMICNSSRGIIYASQGADYAEAARKAAQKFDAEIRDALAA